MKHSTAAILVFALALTGLAPPACADAVHEELPASTTYGDGTASCTTCHDDAHAGAALHGAHGMTGDARAGGGSWLRVVSWAGSRACRRRARVPRGADLRQP